MQEVPCRVGLTPGALADEAFFPSPLAAPPADATGGTLTDWPTASPLAQTPSVTLVETDLAFQAAGQSGISASIPDWSREHKPFFAWMPSRSLLASVRAYQHWKSSRLPWALPLKRWAVLRHRFWSVVTGADIPLKCRIGGGLMLPHPNGIVIHPDVEIGPNCMILQQVTLGTTAKGFPRVGGQVDIGAGAKVLGPVHVGNHARIGANALVLRDVPAGATMVAPQAQVLLRQ
ncbi:MAG: serine acetyltransferase [Pseudomonadota bacterium]